jgi:dienelactone hydrolase
VVLSPQSDDDVCKWLPYARELSTRYRVALVDFGVTGRAAPPVAVRVLRRMGVRRVVLAGASLGGAYALADAHVVRPRLAGVLSLSGEPTLQGSFNVDARPGIRAWHGPLLVLGSAHDGLFNAADARLVARLHPGPETVVTVPGNLHGVDLLTGPEQGRVRAAVEAFLAKVTTVTTTRKHQAR